VSRLLFPALATLLYLKGAPFLSYENQTHAGMVRRLTAMLHPAIDDFYYLPNVAYTYPFPGTHFLMALVSRLGGLDALFVYHKMRFFWGLAALLFVYLLARRIFESDRLGFLSGFTAAAFVLGGGFGDGHGIDWGQLAPISHPSDVAMNVLLPALLVLACYCLQGESRGKAGFFLGASLAMATMVAMVQIRGIVQFIVYLGCFFAALLLYRRERVYLIRTAALIGGSIVVTLAYLWFHRRAVAHIAPLVDAYRAELLATARSLTLARWFSRPLHFVSEFQWMFYGWHPLILAAAPLLWAALRRKTLMLMVGTSILFYLLVIRLPLLSLPFAYVTHWEILVFPLRNLRSHVSLGGRDVLRRRRQFGPHPEAEHRADVGCAGHRLSGSYPVAKRRVFREAPGGVLRSCRGAVHPDPGRPSLSDGRSLGRPAPP
jgi:hypothetical protein